MTITFVSNFLNHHQLHLCHELKKMADKFHFISSENMPETTQKFGYSEMNNVNFVVRAYENATQLEKAKMLIVNSDVVIFGACPSEWIHWRVANDGLTFLYTERFLKKGTWRRFIPTTYKKVYDRTIKFRSKNFYVLCASAYASYDLSLCGFPPSKCLKWGYFPKVIDNDVDELMAKKKSSIPKLLWAGRFLDWKMTSDALEVAKRLKNDGFKFSFDIIGSGLCENKLKEIVNKYDLGDCVNFLGSMPPENVRGYMEKANIYLFTSNFQEGWGAVLNEAMNSGCAVVVSHAIGSVPYLLKNGKNGIIYKNGDFEDFYNKVKYLFDNPQKQKEFGKAAYQTLFDTWNAKVAAKRLLDLSQHLLNGQDFELFDEGPCSNANIIKNNWFK